MTYASAPMAGPDARRQAHAMALDLRTAGHDRLTLGGIDLGPAVEQVLFMALRADGARPGVPPRRFVSALRRPAAILTALRRADALQRADIVVLLLARVHRQLFAPVGESISRTRSDARVVEITAGHASADPVLRALPSIAGQLSVGSALRLERLRLDRPEDVAKRWSAALGARRATALANVARDAVIRLAIEAARLDAAVAAARPRIVVTYDEIDVWSRLLGGIARRHGALAVDLPHAEAVDVEAIRGVDYHAMGVFGPRAASVLEAAGVPPDRVAVLGPARFDALVRSGRAVEMELPPRVLLAAQPMRGRMTVEVRAGTLAAAAAAAAGVEGTLIVKPHPVDRDTDWASLISGLGPSMQDRIHVEPSRELHDLLPGAALLVTAWSNSVYEAVIAGVPALTVHLLPGEPPMPFAAEGIAAQARSPDEAANLARGLIVEPERSTVLRSARAALSDHLGPLDGAATQRTASFVTGLLER